MKTSIFYLLPLLGVFSTAMLAQSSSDISTDEAFQHIDARSMMTKEIATPLSAEGMIRYHIVVSAAGALTHLQRIGNTPKSDYRDLADGWLTIWRFPSRPSDWSATVAVCYDKSLRHLVGCSPADPPDTSDKPVRLVIAGVQENRQFLAAPLQRLKGFPIERSPETRMARIQGSIQLKVIIAPEGKVNDVKVIVGHPMLVAPAMSVLRGHNWKFAPMTFLGEPVETEMLFTAVLTAND